MLMLMLMLMFMIMSMSISHCLTPSGATWYYQCVSPIWPHLAADTLPYKPQAISPKAPQPF